MAKQESLLQDDDHPRDAEDADAAGDGGDATEEAPPRAASGSVKPRARKAAAPAPDDEENEISVFGAVPPRATMFGIRKKNIAGVWETMSYAPPGATLQAEAWPVSELTEDTLYQRWGAGVYEPQWVVPVGNGGRRVQRGGRTVKLLDRGHAPPPAPSPNVTPPGIVLGEDISRTFALMSALDSITNNKLTSMAEMARAFAGGQPQGLTRSDLELLLRDNREATQRLMTEALAPINRRLDEMESGEEDDDPPNPGAPGSPVAAAADVAKSFVKGKGTLATVLNFLGGNPALVATLMPIAGDVVKAVAATIAKGPPTPQNAPHAPVAAPPAQLQPRPRAVPVPVAARPSEPPPLPPGYWRDASGWVHAPEPPPPPPVVPAPPPVEPIPALVVVEEEKAS